MFPLSGQISWLQSSGKWYYNVGSVVQLSCKKTRWLLFGPVNVSCTEYGWTTDINRVQCIKSKNIFKVVKQTAPTVSLALDGEPAGLLTESQNNLTTVEWKVVGGTLRASCQTKWTSTIASKLPKLSTKWFQVTSNGIEIPVPLQRASNIWSSSRSYKKSHRSDLTVTQFKWKGNYTFKCVVTPCQLHGWPSLQARLEVQVTDKLCPRVELPCNTHVIGSIKDENRTENATLHFWPDSGWISSEGQPLKTTCIGGNWDPPISWLGVKRVTCPSIKLGAGIVKQQLDGHWDNHFGSRYKLSCTDPLADIRDFPRVYCNSSGMWDPDPTFATCKKISCGAPPKMPSANCDCPNHNYSIESVCKCTCATGYIFEKGSNKQIECGPAGWWPPTNNLPSCIPCLNQCTLPRGWKLVGNPGGVTRNNRKWMVCQGVEVQVTCKKNSTVRGTARCQKDRWDWNYQGKC